MYSYPLDFQIKPDKDGNISRNTALNNLFHYNVKILKMNTLFLPVLA